MPANAGDPIATIERFIDEVRRVRNAFAPLGVPARRIAQLEVVIMEAEAELRRLRAAAP